MADISLVPGYSGEGAEQTELVTTKLFIPLTSSVLVARPHLLHSLNEGMHKKLTLICAPPGFGKTSLLAEWSVQQRRQGEQSMSIAWVSLDAGDNDPIRFWHYVLTAFQRLAPHIGEEALLWLLSPAPPSIEVILTSVINRLATGTDEVVLVLDDYHVIEASAIHLTLTFLLEHLPPRLHLLLSSRSQPPLPVARWRSRGQVSELHTDDLRFTPSEGEDFFHSVAGLHLTAEEVTTLVQRTEGWIAGLQLAMLSLKGHHEQAQFIRAFSGSHRYILDYLSEEVLGQQPEAVQTFLLQTSILDRLNGSLCDTVTSRQNSQSMLEYLERANLFVVPLDEERNWYRYHHLFRDLLRHHLRRSRPEQIPELHVRAANWYERQGLVAEAVSHALAAPAYSQAMRLIEQVSLTMLYQERGTLRQWIEALPSEQLKHRPRLCLTYAALLATSLDFEATETYLQLAEHSLPGVPEGEETIAVQQMLGEINSLRADLACDRGEIVEAIALCRQALEDIPRDHALLRGKLTLTLGVAYVYQGKIEAAQQALTEAVNLSQAAGNLYGMIQALYRLGWMHMFVGNIRLAYNSYQHALHIVETHPAYSRSPYASLLSIFAGGILAEWNELDSAAQLLSAGIALAEQIELNPIPLEVSYTLLASVRQAQGRMEEAEALMQRVEQIAQQHNMKVLMEAKIVSYRVSLWLAQGKLDAAIQWAEHYRSRLKSDSALSFVSEIEGLALAEVLLAQSRAGRQWPSASPLEEALHVVEQVRHVAEDGRRMAHLLEACVFEALIQQAQGHDEQALETLKKVLRLAEPEGHVRLFVDKGPPMTQLLQQVAASGGASPYLTRLLEAAGVPGSEKKDPHFPKSDAAFPWLEVLSEREVEVLRLLSSGASNTRIAQMLVVSTSTVRTHLRHIYDKLGASNRTQAVARAREFHLLSS